MACEFCGSPRDGWIHPAGDREWLTCKRCHKVIEADDREKLLERVLLRPLPQTLPDRFAPQFRQRARELHESFWTMERGPARPC